MRSTLPVFGLAALGLIAGLLLFRPTAQAEATAPLIQMTLAAVTPPASSLYVLSEAQEPEPQQAGSGPAAAFKRGFARSFHGAR